MRRLKTRSRRPYIATIAACLFTAIPAPAQRLGPCDKLREDAERAGVLARPGVVPDLILHALDSATAKAAWARYQEDVQAVEPQRPFGNGVFRKADGTHVAPEVAKWASDLNEIMGDRDSWVKWNIGIAERMRARSQSTGETIFESMMAVIMAEGEARGFGSDLLILSKAAFQWRAMIRQGKLFVDTFVGRGDEYSHTEIIHANQLLYTQLMLEARGYKVGAMRKIMREFLGNDELVESISLVDPTTGKTRRDYISPWYDLFDAGPQEKKQGQHPEWFGHLWHLIADDIPYDQIRDRYPSNYPPVPD